MIRNGIATDFGWFELKRKLIEALDVVGYELAGIGDYELFTEENYPDFVVPLAKAVSDGNNRQNYAAGLWDHWLQRLFVPEKWGRVLAPSLAQ
jgi:ribose 5-phosphate isomerase RpiB